MISIYFKVKPNIDINKYKLLELFFKDWVDTSCDNNVRYTFVVTTDDGCKRVFCAQFDKAEDALALKLRGLPCEFKSYLEIL